MARQHENATPFEYRLFTLTKEETIKGGECLGFNYAYQNKDRWVNIDSTGYELQTYDRGFTHIFYDGKIYDLFCDYILVEDEIRLFVARFYDSDINKIQPLKDDPYQKKNAEGQKITIKNNGTFRNLETARIQKEKEEKEAAEKEKTE